MKTKKYPSVTVLVTVKNAKETIEKCINSIFRQTYPNFKVFVTDAFSTDGTWEILKRLKKKYGRKLRIERIKGNIARAHNYMVNKVNTKFVAFTDADCIVDKNWLKNLISGFSDEKIIATAGYCGTPKDVNRLQRLIGKELEERFKKRVQFLPHAPTMNLCVRTKYMKRIKFDESLDFAQETDWGFRVTKHGKIKFVPKAKIWHYHRATLLKYLKQQFNQARFTPFVYLKDWKIFLRNLLCIQKDPISNPNMSLQINIFALVLILLLLSVWKVIFLYISFFLFCILTIFQLIEAFKLGEKISEKFYLFLLFFLRVPIWFFGIVAGSFKLILVKIFKSVQIKSKKTDR